MRFIALSMTFVAFSMWASANDPLLSHSTDFAGVAPTEWRAAAWRVDNPDRAATVGSVDGVLAFVVTEPHRAMAWTLTVEPIWTAPFNTMAASYFVEGGVPQDAPAPFGLFDGSTGPITPGATNTENPLASGGRFEGGTFTEGLHIDLIDLTVAENLDRVAEITITVRSGDAPVVLRLNQLAFLASERIPVEGEESPAWSSLTENSPFTALGLPDANAVTPGAFATQMGVEASWWQAEVGEIGGLPFRLGAHAVATPLTEGGAITVAAGGTGNTLALLCAARLWGSDLGWYSKNYVPIRRNAAHPDQFVATLTYADGSETQAIPQRTDQKKPGLWPGSGAYTVAVDPEKTLEFVTLEEGMSFGQVILLAASLVDRETTAAVPAPVEPTIAARALELPEEHFTIEGERIRIVLDGRGIVYSLQIGTERHELVEEGFPLLTLIDPDGEALPLTLVEALQVPNQDRLVMIWDVGGERQCEFSMTLTDTGAVECVATLSNRGERDWDLVGVLPRLTQLRISRGGRPAYVLGGRSAILDTKPIDTADIYGGQYPNQFMDLYDEEFGGGLAYIVQDQTLARKWFEFKLDKTGWANMAVSYRRLKVAPGARHALPPVILQPHEGDWRAPFGLYRDWVRQSFPRTRSTAMDDVFYCRRDYPLGGTSYLFDVDKPAYSFDTLIAESTWAFGGVDMVDISGWAYNEEVGRVGTYLENDLGGLDALAKGVWASHNKKVQVGLYFEGYLLDKRAARAEEGLADWQLIREGDKPAWWPSEMEFFCCPGSAGWQDALAGDIAAVAAKTKADAVYVDQLGICGTDKECWSPRHGHAVPSNPIETEIALLQRIRTELDKVRPQCAIYIEHIPCDAMVPYIDGAFNLGMKHKKHPLGPTKLPLHRYLHPDVPVFEMVAHGIRPIPAEEDDLKLAFFHGMGLWLKGRGASWYSEGFREKAAAFYPIYQKFGAYFRSPDAEPHVDTLQPGVYANRFPHDGNVIYTIYNANSTTVHGPLLALPEGAGGGITSLVEGGDLSLDADDAGMVLVGSIPPEGVAGVFVQRGE